MEKLDFRWGRIFEKRLHAKVGFSSGEDFPLRAASKTSQQRKRQNSVKDQAALPSATTRSQTRECRANVARACYDSFSDS